MRTLISNWPHLPPLLVQGALQRLLSIAHDAAQVRAAKLYQQEAQSRSVVHSAIN